MTIPAAPVAAIAESIIAAAIYERATSAGAGQHTKAQGQNLKKALTQYLDDARQRYGSDGDAILEELKNRIPSGNAYYRVLKSSCDGQKMLTIWMEGYNGDFPEEVRSLCRGCIDIIIAYVKQSPEFVPDVTAQTLAEVEELKQVLIRVMQILAKLNLSPEEYPPLLTSADHSEAYRSKWTDPLFLNDPSTCWNAETVAAQDLYVPLRFRFGKETHPREDRDNALWNVLSRPGGHVVLGDPGIGKSTLISRFLEDRDLNATILAYTLTEFGLTGNEKHPGSLLLQKIGWSPESLVNAVIFLDGLDECAITPEIRASFLRKLQADWRRSFPWVVTCRLNYIPEKDLKSLTIPRFTLCPMNSDQIESFITRYESKAKRTIATPTKIALIDSERNNVFGIPLILYMIVASELHITKEDTLVTVYDKLFDSEGAFYRRRYDIHRTSLSDEYIRQARQMSRDIALWMLLHNSERAAIPEEAYGEIEQVFDPDAEGALRLDTFLHRGIVEGESDLCFVHRTMYEYFATEGFVSLATGADTPETLSFVIAWYWHETRMDDNVAKYLSEKLSQKKSHLSLDRWEAAGLLLLEKGVRRCLPGEDEWKELHGWTLPDCLRPSDGRTLADDRRRENALFWNLCHLLDAVRRITGTCKWVYQDNQAATPLLASAIRNCYAERTTVFCPKFDLDHADLSAAHLSDAVFSGANLSGAVLCRAVLPRAILSGANLSGANLSGAVLSASVLSRAVLSRAVLSGADLYQTDLAFADLSAASLSQEQPQEIGYEQLMSCTFDNIFIRGERFTRSEFFARFFPNKPYLGDNP